MTNGTQVIPGQDEAHRQWSAALGSDRLHHAWLLAGPRGLGKGAFAVQAARDVVGVSTDGDHPDILKLSHPPKDKKEADKQAAGKPFELARNIKVDQIRAMQGRLTTRPTLGARRAIVVDPADDMEKGAANALLKSLEEPPDGTIFLLVAHAPARLLPTIRSRCRVLRFRPLGDATLTNLLEANHGSHSREAIAAAVAHGAGSPGRAVQFLDMELGDIAETMHRLLVQGDDDFQLRGELARQIGARPKRERLAAVLDLARLVLANRIADTVSRDLGRVEGAALADAHAALVQLAREVPTYNFDPQLLAAQIGGLLARAASPRAAANA